MSFERPASFLHRNARYFIALLFFLLLLQDVFGTHGLLAMHRSKNQIWEVRSEIQRLNQENQDLEQKVEKLKTDPNAIEKIARDRMGLARPGELIFRLPDQKNGQSATQPGAQPPAKNPPIPPKN